MEKNMVIRSKEYIGNITMQDATAWTAIRHAQHIDKKIIDPMEESLAHLEKRVQLGQMTHGAFYKKLRKIYRAYSNGRLK